MASQARAKQQAEKTVLMTQKLREQEKLRRAANIGPVPLRIHFPDDVILQASLFFDTDSCKQVCLC